MTTAHQRVRTRKGGGMSDVKPCKCHHIDRTLARQLALLFVYIVATVMTLLGVALDGSSPIFVLIPTLLGAHVISKMRTR